MNAHPASSLQRLELLQRLASQQEDHAARQLADALARHANAEDRRAELYHYELEYASRTPSGGAQSGHAAASVMTLAHHAGFLAKLREAVRFQSERVQNFAAEVELARSRWVALHCELEKLGQLDSSARQQLRQLESRREARELDELASRGWVQRQALG